MRYWNLCELRSAKRFNSIDPTHWKPQGIITRNLSSGYEAPRSGGSRIPMTHNKPIDPTR